MRTPPYRGAVGLIGVGFAALALTTLAGACDAGGGPASSLEVRDFSDFEQFAFSRQPGLGFCPPLDAVFSANLSADQDGGYVVNLSVLEQGVAGQDECLGPPDYSSVYVIGPDDEPVDCVVETQLPERVLASDETQAVLDTFSEVRIDNEADPVCSQASIDPCVINQFTFDSFAVSGFMCAAPRLRDAQRAVLLDLLEQLREGG